MKSFRNYFFPVHSYFKVEAILIFFKDFNGIKENRRDIIKIIMIIKTENLKRHFQVGSETVEALKGINLSVEKGEFLSIMGPSGSGKTTIAKSVSKKLHKKGVITQVLDGDNIRIGINNNLSFSEEDRFEKMDLNFHNNLREAFIEISKGDPDRFILIDAELDVSVISEIISNEVMNRLIL